MSRPARRQRCGAHARRANAPCRRWAVAGKERCRLHGGVGPTTPEATERRDLARLEHGAYLKLGPYARALAAVDPEYFAEAPTSTNLDDELRFARAKLAALAKRAATGADSAAATESLLTQIRLLVAQKHEINPGADVSGKFEIAIKMVGYVCPNCGHIDDPTAHRPRAALKAEEEV